jgi:hypothetical protein
MLAKTQFLASSKGTELRLHNSLTLGARSASSYPMISVPSNPTTSAGSFLVLISEGEAAI